MLNSEEKYREFQKALEEKLQKYNFKYSRKGHYQRKVGNCLQYIQITVTKTRNKDEFHMMPIVGYGFEKLDKVIAFLKNRKYEKEFGTGALTLDYFQNGNKTYAFYINSNTDIVPIVDDIVENIERYAFSFLDSCSTLEKYETMLDTEKEKMTYAAVMKYEWSLLALSLLLQRNNYTSILEDYKAELSKDRVAFDNVEERIKQLLDRNMEV